MKFKVVEILQSQDIIDDEEAGYPMVNYREKKTPVGIFDDLRLADSYMRYLEEKGGGLLQTAHRNPNRYDITTYCIETEMVSLKND